MILSYDGTLVSIEPQEEVLYYCAPSLPVVNTFGQGPGVPSLHSLSCVVHIVLAACSIHV